MKVRIDPFAYAHFQDRDSRVDLTCNNLLGLDLLCLIAAPRGLNVEYRAGGVYLYHQADRASFLGANLVERVIAALSSDVAEVRNAAVAQWEELTGEPSYALDPIGGITSDEIAQFQEWYDDCRDDCADPVYFGPSSDA
jgi:hypothetical protein